MRYSVAEPNEYLVLTGAGIRNVRITKKAFVWPLQRCSRLTISPFDFSLNLQAMTIEKLQFSLPAVFTIGPDDQSDSLQKYAVLLSDGYSKTKARKSNITAAGGRSHVQDIVKGIIEGETRVIVSSMSMEEIFKERQVFKQKVIQNVQSELDQFGLRIYNANVKELQDTPGSEYFAFLSRKAHEGALNQAKVDVAEARMRGHIGEAEKQGKTKQEVSKIDAETAVLETKRKSEKATADNQLATRQMELDSQLNMSRIKAKRDVDAMDAELQKLVEMKRAEMELERLRATEVTRGVTSREVAQQVADAKLYEKKKDADARLYAFSKDIEQQRLQVEASFYKASKEADAARYAKIKEAEGIEQVARAYGSLANAMGGAQGLLQYLMLQNNTYEKLARENAKAIQGLSPKITVWNTGNESATADSTAPIRNLFQSLPPLLSTINEQTGIAPPSWMARMAEQGMSNETKPLVNGDKMVTSKKA